MNTLASAAWTSVAHALGGATTVPIPSNSQSAGWLQMGGRRWWLLVMVIALVLAIVFGEAWLSSRAGGASSYVTTPASLGAIAPTITGSGTVNPVTTVQVGTYVSGVIQELLCDYNTAVKKGQLCARIDPRPYQTVVDQEQANVSMAKAQLAKDETNLRYAELTNDRDLDLLKRGIATQDAADSASSAFDQAQAQVDVDRSAIEQREASLKAARINLDYTHIVSPVNGTVVSRNVTMGQTVAASFQTPTLFLIATDLTSMEVDVNVSAPRSSFCRRRPDSSCRAGSTGASASGWGSGFGRGDGERPTWSGRRTRDVAVATAIRVAAAEARTSSEVLR